MIGIIFDCDGTLVDSMGAWHEVDRTLAAEAGITLTEADAEAITTMSLPEASAYLHEQCGLGESNEAVLEMILRPHARLLRQRSGGSSGRAGLRAGPARARRAYGGSLLHAGRYAGHLYGTLWVRPLHEDRRVCGRPADEQTRTGCLRPRPRFLGTDRAHTWAFEDAAYALDTLRAAGYRTGAIYDNDISGTRDQLFERADFLIASWEDLDPDIFLAKAGA